MNKIKLKANDGIVIEADLKIANYFGTINRLLEHYDNLGTDEIVELGDVNSNILKRTLEWAEHHLEHPKDQLSRNCDEIDEPIKRKLTDVLTAWEKEFLKVDIEKLFLYLRAANYLEVEDLHDVIVRIIANLLIGKSADEIRRKFHEIEKNKSTVI